MAITLDSISKGKALKAPRIVLLGVEKVGKSTLASQAPAPIFLPIKGEEGTDAIDVPKFPTARSYDEVVEMLGALYQGDHEYSTVVIDSMSTLEPLIWDKTSREGGVTSIEKVGGGFGKGYIEALKYWREITDGLDALREDRNIASILIGHVKVKAFNDPLADSYDTYLFDLHERASNLLYRWADAILFCNFKTIVKTTEAGFGKKNTRGVGGERVLYTEKRPGHPGGNRYSMPYELQMNWQSIEQAIAKRSPAPESNT